MREQLRKKREEGFTLIELLIVIIILAILAAIVVFAVGGTAGNAKIAACNSDSKSVETALEAYKAQMGAYPAGLSTLTGTFVDPQGQTDGPWIRQIPNANTSNDGYSLVYPGAAGTGHLDVVASGQAAADYDGATNPCNKA